jgi:hypothetical protein
VADRTLKQGDNWIPLYATLQAATTLNGTPTYLDLTTASQVTLVMKSGAILISGSMAIASALGGRVRYDWGTAGAADTASIGTYDVEFEIVWNNGKTETVPNTGTRQLIIEDDLRP